MKEVKVVQEMIEMNTKAASEQRLTKKKKRKNTIESKPNLRMNGGGEGGASLCT